MNSPVFCARCVLFFDSRGISNTQKSKRKRLVNIYLHTLLISILPSLFSQCIYFFLCSLRLLDVVCPLSLPPSCVPVCSSSHLFQLFSTFLKVSPLRSFSERSISFFFLFIFKKIIITTKSSYLNITLLLIKTSEINPNVPFSVTFYLIWRNVELIHWWANLSHDRSILKWYQKWLC